MKTGIILTALILMISLAGTTCTTTLLPRAGETQEDYQRIFEAAYEQLQINEPSQRSDEQPLVLAHYMPWFQKYGFHWSEGGARFDPSEILPDGRANIASHYYPLTGNYDSSDMAVLDYQLALMKMSGIDGVIFDWYGITEGIDYKPIHEATLVMIEMIKKRGMKYAICYEDQSIKHLIEFGIIPRDQGLNVARDTFNWMAENWFTDDAYVKVDGRPLVLCFGPQHFYQKAEWDEIWEDLTVKPLFVDLDARTSWADATQNWSPMHLSTSGRLSIPSFVRYLNEYYRRQEHKPFVVGTVVPSFHDIYAQAGGRSYGFLDYYGGETLKLTWAAAEQARANVIQIQTWNDYGEGTIVEPTIERGYSDLEFIQDKRLIWEPDFPFNYSDLRIPIELYKILANENSTEEQKNQVAGIYDLIFSGDSFAFRQAVRDADIRFDFTVRPLLFEFTEGGDQPVQAFDPAGRRNLALGQPVFASSRIDVYTANRAVDGNISSYWEGAARSYPATLQVDLVTQERIATIVVKLNPSRMWSRRTQRFEVRISNNGNDWTTLVPEADYIFDPVENNNTAVIPVNTAARFVQLVFTANSGATSGQVAEFEIYGE